MTDRSSATISVMLIVPDATAALAWYKEALGATVLWDLNGVAALSVAGAAFFVHAVNPANPAERSPAEVGATSTRIELLVGDPDAFLDRAIAAGASIRSAMQDHEAPWGSHRQGGFTDPFGHAWSVGDTTPLTGLED